MVQLGTACLRRLAQGRNQVEVRFGRLLRNPKVTVESIVAGWSEETAPAAQGRHVLAIQDTSEINFKTTEGRRRGLGTIGKGVGRGLLLHPMIAVDATTRECLGLVGGSLWTRAEPTAAKKKAASRKAAAAKRKRKQKQKKKGKSKRRPLSAKESRHWVETALTARKTLAQAAMVTMIADREADLYQMWAQVPDTTVHVLGRAYHDRKLVGGGTLTTAAAAWPVLGTRSVTIREREDAPEREAELVLKAGRITVPRPEGRGDAASPPEVTLTLIELVEPNPPDGAEPVVWRLLTTHVAADAAEAWRIVDWYRMRWLIEQFFRILKKQGFQVEDSQVETADALLKLVAIAARAAIITLQLTQARDGLSTLPALLVFSTAELGLLEALNHDYAGPAPSRRNPHTPHSLAWAAWIVARLGGWTGYTGKARPPGPITFKNGLDLLRSMARGWELRDVYIP